MQESGKKTFYPYGQTRWPRLKKSLLVWDPVMKITKKASNIPVVGKYLTWFWDEDHFNQTMIPVNVPVNAEIDGDETTILPVAVVEEMVRKSCHTVKMHLCLCRTACACEEFPMGLGCLFLGESTRDIHPSMGKPITVDEALDHVRDAVRQGLVMHIGKVDPDPYMLGLRDRKRFLTLCFCCPCCCVAMKDFLYFAPEIRARTHRLEGLEMRVSDDCNGCRKCVNACYASAIRMEGKRAVITDGCKGCGLCVAKCPAQAISMTISDGNRMLSEALTRIQKHSDVT